MKTDYFECRCLCGSHIIRIMEDTDDPEDPCLYLEVQLSPYYGISRRIWAAIKYVLGLEEKCGHWDCTLMEDKDVEKLRDLCTAYLDKIKV